MIDKSRRPISYLRRLGGGEDMTSTSVDVQGRSDVLVIGGGVLVRVLRLLPERVG